MSSSSTAPGIKAWSSPSSTAGENIGQDELGHPPGRAEICIAPVIEGKKRSGGLQTVIGVALIAAASYFSRGLAAGAAGSGSLFGTAGYAGGAAWAAVGTVGISLAIGGIPQMVTKQPTGLSNSDSADNSPSYSFNGPGKYPGARQSGAAALWPDDRQ
ncbi:MULTISPECIES: hypothetical protein [unclassified Pseudomonas]|uniref:hypothetical protein n=1 Tax=unclassified Pseudomonas TaxID=196821 RepID=UPI002114F3E7|nr:MULTISPECIES: hypothetical protein [unclassified Pseudomonas]